MTTPRIGDTVHYVPRLRPRCDQAVVDGLHPQFGPKSVSLTVKHPTGADYTTHDTHHDPERAPGTWHHIH